MSARLLMICPSRGRPENVRRLLQAWRVTDAEADLVIAVDDDDPELERYQDVFWDQTSGVRRLISVELRIGEREWMGPTLNRIAVDRADDYFALGFLGDDHVPRTEHWDRWMLEALDELGSGVVYGNDLLQGAALATAVALTSDVVRTLGWLVPPGQIHLYLDNAWLDIGRGMGRLTYLPDVVIEHMHPVAGKASMDEGYAEVNSAELYASDLAAYRAWQRGSMAADVARLRELVT